MNICFKHKFYLFEFEFSVFEAFKSRKFEFIFCFWRAELLNKWSTTNGARTASSSSYVLGMYTNFSPAWMAARMLLLSLDLDLNCFGHVAKCKKEKVRVDIDAATFTFSSWWYELYPERPYLATYEPYIRRGSRVFRSDISFSFLFFFQV